MFLLAYGVSASDELLGGPYAVSYCVDANYAEEYTCSYCNGCVNYILYYDAIWIDQSNNEIYGTERHSEYEFHTKPACSHFGSTLICYYKLHYGDTMV